MHHANHQTPTQDTTICGRLRWAPRSAGVLLGMGLLLGGAPAAQASDDAVHPLGQCVDGKLVAGQGYVTIQAYDVVNSWVGRCHPDDEGLACKHGGIDIQQANDDDGATVNDPVYAMANGEVLDLIGWGGTGPDGEGEGVLVLHRDGSLAHYVHLAQVYVTRGQVVRQGQPLGRLMDYPYGGEDNDHLHLEYRRPVERTVRACPNTEDTKDCADETDFRWQCKGNGYALDDADATASAIVLADYGYVDPRPGLRTAIEVPEIPNWTPPDADPLMDLRFNPDDSSIVNYGAGDGLVSGSAEIKRPYEDMDADFCDYQGRLEAGGELSVPGSDSTSFAAGVVFDLDLELDQITSTEWVEILRAGDDDETTWRLVARYDESTATRQLGFQVTVAAAADGGDGAADDGTTGATTGTGAADEPAGETTVLEAVGTLSEPQCGAAPVAGTCAPAPEVCPPAPDNCDPAPSANVPIHCFSDFGYRQWRHVAGTYDETNQIFQLQLDGEVFATNDVGGQLQAPSDTFTMYVGGGMGMKVDDVRVWDLSNLDGEKSDKSDDAFDTFGDVSRGMESNGCQCSAGSGTGAGGSLLLLLGLWGLRRRWSA